LTPEGITDPLYAGSTKTESEHLIAVILAHPRTRSVLQAALEPLHEYDRSHRTSLFRTLEVFADADGSALEAARLLGVHRHTIDYRIRRVESILGHSVRSGADRVVTELALIADRASRGSLDLDRDESAQAETGEDE
jgi:DNA-binding PucR family transcriptional regulator